MTAQLLHAPASTLTHCLLTDDPTDAARSIYEHLCSMCEHDWISTDARSCKRPDTDQLQRVQLEMNVRLCAAEGEHR